MRGFESHPRLQAIYQQRFRWSVEIENLYRCCLEADEERTVKSHHFNLDGVVTVESDLSVVDLSPNADLLWYDAKRPLHKVHGLPACKFSMGPLRKAIATRAFASM